MPFLLCCRPKRKLIRRHDSNSSSNNNIMHEHLPLSPPIDLHPHLYRSLAFGDFADPTFSCPATTTCPVVCVASLADCPADALCPGTHPDDGAPSSPSSSSRQYQLCNDGSCADLTAGQTCDPASESPCDCDALRFACVFERRGPEIRRVLRCQRPLFGGAGGVVGAGRFCRAVVLDQLRGHGVRDGGDIGLVCMESAMEPCGGECRGVGDGGGVGRGGSEGQCRHWGAERWRRKTTTRQTPQSARRETSKRKRPKTHYPLAQNPPKAGSPPPSRSTRLGPKRDTNPHSLAPSSTPLLLGTSPDRGT